MFNVFQGRVLFVPPHLFFEIVTKEIDFLPRTGTPVFVELNYKCNTAVQVGVFANYNQNPVIEVPIFTINPKNEWNKIYIDLTSAIISTQNANSHKVFISMRRDVNSTEMAELHIDNFKLIY